MNPGPGNIGNIDRFPHDFAFRFTLGEWALLSSQIATLKTSRSPLSLTHRFSEVVTGLPQPEPLQRFFAWAP